MWWLCIPVGLAWSIDEVPNPRANNVWISDVADIISPEVEAALEQRLQALHDDLTVEIAVVTLDSIESSGTPKSFATGLFNHWGIGSAEANNGLLVLMVMDQRRLEMETGYGLESVLPDGFLGQLQAQHMVPHFKTGDFSTGMTAGLEAIDVRLREYPEAARTGTGGPMDIPTPSTTPSTTSRHRTTSSSSGSSSSGMSNEELFAYGGGSLALLTGVGVAIKRRRDRTCPTCKKRMAQLDESSEDAHLSAGQQTEESIGSIDWHVYHCVDCDFHRVVPRYRIFSGYSRCPRCSNRTRSSSSTTIRAATYTSGGLIQVDERCAHCSYSRSYTRSTPKRTPPSSSSSSSSGSSGGGSSFGGGRSGGGGAGSSW